MSKEVDKMIFRKAEKEDFYKIRSLYWNLIDQEKDDPSFPHWKKGIHPSDKMIQDSIATGQLYVLSDDEEIVACVIANDEKVDGYSDVPWQIDSDEVIVLHVLAVHPDHGRKSSSFRYNRQPESVHIQCLPLPVHSLSVPRYQRRTQGDADHKPPGGSHASVDFPQRKSPAPCVH